MDIFLYDFASCPQANKISRNWFANMLFALLGPMTPKLGWKHLHPVFLLQRLRF